MLQEKSPPAETTAATGEKLSTSEPTSPDAARQFLESLHGPALTATDGVIALFATPGGATTFCRATTAASEAAMRLASAHNVYCGINPVRPGIRSGRGKLADIVALAALVADLDCGPDPKRNKSRFPDKAAARAFLDERLSLAPSMIVDSGSGLHAYWLLAAPWIFASDADRQAAAVMSQAWGQNIQAIAKRDCGVELDSVFDLTRVLRVPGTKNHKTDPPTPVLLVKSDEPRYRRADFQRALNASTPPQAKAKPKRAAAGRSNGALKLSLDRRMDADTLAAFRSDPKFDRTWKQKRTDLTDQSPSGYDLALADAIVKSGGTDQDIADALIHRRTVRNENPAKALRPDYIRRTIVTAREARNGKAGPSSGGQVLPKTAINASGSDADDGRWRAWAIGKVRRTLRRLTPTENIRIYEYGSGDDASYILADDHFQVKLGSIDAALRWERAQAKIVGQTHVFLASGADDDDDDGFTDSGRVTGRKWKGVLALLIDERLLVQNGRDDTQERRLHELLDEYAATAACLDLDLADAIARRLAIADHRLLLGATSERSYQKPFFDRDGRMYIHLPSFRFWSMRRGGELVTEKRIADQLRQGGFSKTRFYATATLDESVRTAAEDTDVVDFPDRSWRWVSATGFREELIGPNAHPPTFLHKGGEASSPRKRRCHGRSTPND